MKKLKVGELVIDYTLYPRSNVDSHNIGRIREAHAAGVTLPPLVICKKTRRIADGVHRTKFYLQDFGEDFQVEVIEKNYPTDADFYEDAIRLNASHGAKLDTHDRVHCITVAERLGLSIERVAGALNMPVDKLSALRADRMATAGALSVPLKRTVRHFAGRKLTKRQVECNTRLTGLNQQTYANQLIDLIESNMLDTEDEKLMERLQYLATLLDGVLAVA